MCNHFSILVTGSSGQLGSEIKAIHSKYPYKFYFANKKELNIFNFEDVRKYIIENNINVIINCAAYTSVDKAENEKGLAYNINYLCVKNLAMLAKEFDIMLIQISTDYVFNGLNCKPYAEEDNVGPVNVYGQTKLNGEKAILKYGLKNSIIIRTSWVYSYYGNNFVKTILRLASEKNEIQVIFDQIGTPTYAKDLAEAIMSMIPKIKNKKTEIYHYSNEGVASWYDFAKEILFISNSFCKVVPIQKSQYKTLADRPHYAVLSKDKIKAAFNLEIPYWRDSLVDCLDRLKIKINKDKI